jgi:Mor family transcriptional regulator
MTSKINEDVLEQIVIDMETENRTFTQIIKHYKITAYQYYKIMKDYNLQPEVFKSGPKGPTGPKRTKLTEILQGPIELVESMDTLLTTFDKKAFIEDNKNGMKIKELMTKYDLSLYQMRELRKRFDLKKR